MLIYLIAFVALLDAFILRQHAHRLKLLEKTMAATQADIDAFEAKLITWDTSLTGIGAAQETQKTEIASLNAQIAALGVPLNTDALSATVATIDAHLAALVTPPAV